MASFFDKPLDEITAADIRDLVGVAEGQVFEIKRELATKPEGGVRRPDSWLTTPAADRPRSGPGDYAKFNLFREVCAFANTEGGWLVLGLAETDDKPPRVDAVVAIPDCEELANRLSQAGQDWLDPPLRNVRWRGVVVGGGPGEGVVVARVPRSAMAPHRLTRVEKDAFRRVGHESRPVTMREIHDMVLDRAGEEGRVERDLRFLLDRYKAERPARTNRRRFMGFSIAALPVAGSLTLDRPYEHTALFTRQLGFQIRFTDGAGGDIEIATLDATSGSRTTRLIPMLRAARRVESCLNREGRPGREEQSEDRCDVEIYETGGVHLGVKTNNGEFVGLSLKWVLADIANALRIVHRCRTAAGQPEAEYAMRVDLRWDDFDGPRWERAVGEKLPFGLLQDELVFPKRLDNPMTLPRYVIGPGAEALHPVLNRALNDLLNAAGERHRDTVDFQSMLQDI